MGQSGTGAMARWPCQGVEGRFSSRTGWWRPSQKAHWPLRSLEGSPSVNQHPGVPLALCWGSLPSPSRPPLSSLGHISSQVCVLCSLPKDTQETRQAITTIPGKGRCTWAEISMLGVGASIEGWCLEGLHAALQEAVKVTSLGKKFFTRMTKQRISE